MLAQRIASINLCADQLLLELADPARIAGVSTLAGDPALSFLASKAAPYRKLRGNAEQLFRLKADLVLTGSFDRPYARSILQRRGVKYKAVEPWTNIAQGRQQISTFAAQLGVPEKGAELIRRIDAALEKLRASAKS
ncbi:MAG: ABC transporter substrate-binding protein, partial [Beijerinckiaceae bacterium]